MMSCRVRMPLPEYREREKMNLPPSRRAEWDMRKLLPCILPLMLIAFAGCNTCPKPSGYFGPTDSMDRVVADINANNEKIPSLWSSLYYRANIVDEKKQGHSLNGEGVFL